MGHLDVSGVDRAPKQGQRPTNGKDKVYKLGTWLDRGWVAYRALVGSKEINKKTGDAGFFIYYNAATFLTFL